jgi:aromatic ring-opening dioxygenase catalytic subunit (LigB family)
MLDKVLIAKLAEEKMEEIRIKGMQLNDDIDAIQSLLARLEAKGHLALSIAKLASVADEIITAASGRSVHDLDLATIKIAFKAAAGKATELNDTQQETMLAAQARLLKLLEKCTEVRDKYREEYLQIALLHKECSA